MKTETKEKKVVLSRAAIPALADYACACGARRAFLLADTNTYPLAGESIRAALAARGVDSLVYVLDDNTAEPDERAVGSVFLHFDETCDLVVGIGSGVINDLSKLLSHRTGLPFAMFATAPSMDGWASPLSSMVRDGLKVSIPTKRADIILADPAILAAAPKRLLRAGLGDMLAKLVSITEWRVGHLLSGEHYDETIAAAVRAAVRACIEQADALLSEEPPAKTTTATAATATANNATPAAPLSRKEEAACAVFRGLVLTGEAMEKAGCSRPASGGEHYLSHLWDMRALAFGTPCDLHGLQCAAATYICACLWKSLPLTPPTRALALAHAREYDNAAHNARLSSFLGAAAAPMIALEEKEGKRDPARHEERLSLILSHYDEILAIVKEELPEIEALSHLYATLGLPTSPPEPSVLAESLYFAGDIRDKYVLSRLLWDLDLLDGVCASLG